MAKEPDLAERVYEIAKYHASDKEIATILGLTAGAFSSRKRRDPRIQQAIDLGRAEFKLDIRKRQLKACDAKNPVMLIWLGKQVLGQTDERSMRHTGSVELNLAAAREGAMQKFRQLRSARAESIEAAKPAEIEAGGPVIDAEVVDGSEVPAERGESAVDSGSADQGSGFGGLSILPDP